ncbi:hypothetical protein UFOVP298_23 [uncultured Caudovirales phage]|uniref:Uncharacterized protein n=1 Tax=uncultured Caudovirales phage TaxID=2100421 RepID=A0A6J5N4L0_9CAUD|nr:hypothetical protein UFOVP298_23 [uncultured Caudovirales phage]CAB4150689.1 hypothetical protein UFOVP572_16 [uncultured Caudovirales phage]
MERSAESQPHIRARRTLTGPGSQTVAFGLPILFGQIIQALTQMFCGISFQAEMNQSESFGLGETTRP